MKEKDREERGTGMNVLVLLYEENIEKSFSQNVLKINGRNLQCMIKTF